VNPALLAVQRLLFSSLVAVIAAMPTPAALRRWCLLMAAVMRPFGGAWRRLVRRNLRLVYGDTLSVEQRRAIVRGVFEHSAHGFGELFWLPQEHGMAVADWCDVEGIEHLDAALRAGKGVLLATAHLGGWTLLPRYLHERGYSTGSLLRLPSNPVAHAAEADAVTRMGLTFFNTPLSREHANACLRLLRGNGVLFIVADRRSADVKVDFLGQPAWCATGTASLHLRTGAAIVPAYAVRVGDRHRLVYEPALRCTPSGDRRADEAAITAELHRIFGTWIRQFPEQWMWNHNRWRPRRSEMKEARHEHRQ
jgi:KDO2-lipid IV(A) lauroyltransferase